MNSSKYDAFISANNISDYSLNKDQGFYDTKKPFVAREKENLF